MSISCTSQPTTWARAADTNQFVYRFTSTNYTQPNFRYLIEPLLYDNGTSSTALGTYLLHPASDGSCEFNPSAIYQNYLSQDINLSATGLTEMFNTIKGFKLTVYEYYGTPPTKKGGGNWVETQITAYNGAQQMIPYTYTTLNPQGNLKWVMTGSTSGQFLTDATEYYADNTDLGFVYALGNNTNGRPTRIRYTYWYNAVPSYNNDDGGSPSYDRQPAGINVQQAQPNPKPIYDLDAPTRPPIVFRTTLTSGVTYDTAVTFSSNYTYGYYIPCGPYQTMTMRNILRTWKYNWVYYDVDILATNTVLNKYPIRFIKNNICSKYGDWQLFWFNPHGGFDTFTFDRKNELNYKINRTTYKQKLPPTYSPYSAGEKVLNIESIEELTLVSNLISQQEAQLLTQLAQSPVVYAVKKYNYNSTTTIYGVPYIVVDTSIKYEQKVNDKEIIMSITIRPANEKIIQRN